MRPVKDKEAPPSVWKSHQILTRSAIDIANKDITLYPNNKSKPEATQWASGLLLLLGRLAAGYWLDWRLVLIQHKLCQHCHADRQSAVAEVEAVIMDPHFLFTRYCHT